MIRAHVGGQYRKLRQMRRLQLGLIIPCASSYERAEDRPMDRPALPFVAPWPPLLPVVSPMVDIPPCASSLTIGPSYTGALLLALLVNGSSSIRPCEATHINYFPLFFLYTSYSTRISCQGFEKSDFWSRCCIGRARATSGPLRPIRRLACLSERDACGGGGSR